ncbi:putative reverse transcriptase domain-containing protein [Tanacetum coccineum]
MQRQQQHLHTTKQVAVNARAYVAAPAEGRGYVGNLPRALGAGVTPLQDVTCYGCGEKGNYKDKCPKGRNQQNEGTRRRS